MRAGVFGFWSGLKPVSPRGRASHRIGVKPLLLREGCSSARSFALYVGRKVHFSAERASQEKRAVAARDLG